MIASMIYVVEDVLCGERIGCVGNSYSQDSQATVRLIKIKHVSHLITIFVMRP